MKKIYAIILGFTAVLLAVAAAYFSVFGLSKLFIGAALSVIIMAGTLEFSKIVIVSFLHQYWKKLAKGLKTYLLLGTVILMIITSVGIYGFLSSAYSKVSTDLEKMGGNIELLDKRIEIKKEEKFRLDEQIKTKNERVMSLTNLRKSQEARLDSLYQRGWVAAAKKTGTVITQADENIANLNIEIDGISSKIENLNDSIAKYETAKLEESVSNIAGEVGPLKYISKLTGLNMDTVVNWLILLLIIVFDPLAVALIISTSSMIKMIREEREIKKDEDRDESFRKKVKYVSDEQGNFKLEDELEITLKEKPFIKIPIIEDSPAETELKEQSVKEPVVEELAIEESVTDEPATEETVAEESAIEERVVEEPAVEERVVEGPAVEEEIVSEEPWIQNNIDEEPWNEQQNTEEVIVQKAPETNSVSLSTDEFVIDESKKQSIYLRLLQILYKNGDRKKGDKIPNYLELRKDIEEKMPNLTEKDTKDFLLVCNLFKITDFKDGIGYFEKEYPQAFALVSKV